MAVYCVSETADWFQVGGTVTQADRDAVDEDTLNAIEELVRVRSGMVFSYSRRDALHRAITEALGTQHLASPQALLQHFVSGPAGQLALHDFVLSLTVGETYFWRNRPQFEALEQVILPELLGRTPEASRLNVWSAACSTGEEPYSLAILFHKVLRASGGRPLSILGTDLNPLALEAARQALYPSWSFRDTPEGFQERYFDPVGTRWLVKPDLRRAVHFKLLNLMEPAGWAGAGIDHLDLILCRNVLIYFDEKGVETVLHGLYDALNPNGWLVLGHADAFQLATRLFSAVTFPGAILYQKRSTPQAPVRSSRVTARGGAADPPSWGSSAPGRSSGHPAPAGPSDLRALPGRSSVHRPHGGGHGTVRKSGADGTHAPVSSLGASALKHAVQTPALQPPVLQPPAVPTSGLQMPVKGVPVVPSVSRIEPILGALRARQVDDALARLVLLGSREKLSPQEMLQVAEALADQHCFEQAEAWCGRTLAQDSQNARAYYLLGILRMGRGQLDPAIQALRRAVYLQPEFLLARMSLSEALMRAGETQRARKELDVILEQLAAVPADTPVPGSSGLTNRQLRLMVEARQKL